MFLSVIKNICLNLVQAYNQREDIGVKFECPRYGGHRATLAARVIEILQRNSLNRQGNLAGLYLYGHKSLKLTDNKIILLSTIKYIKDTQRFSL